MRDKIKEKTKQRFLRYNAKSFWQKYQDYFAYGALGLVVLFIVISNFSGDRRKLSEIPVNEDEFILQHNDANLPFKLGRNEFFEGQTLATVKDIVNNRFSTKKTINKCNPKLVDTVIVPDEYNFYKDQPDCKTNEVARFCSASYVEMPLSIYRNRNCKAKADSATIPSLGYLLSCDRKNNNGCKGGYIANSMEFMTKFGLITEDCWKSVKGETDECPSSAEMQKCTREYIESYCVFELIDEMKKEIFKNGPIASFMTPFRDFLIYKEGVYHFGDKQKIDGMIFVKIVGWTTNSDGTQSWLVDPMWGPTWGEEGLAKVAMGHEESMLDKVGIVLYPTALEKKRKEEIETENE